MIYVVLLVALLAIAGGVIAWVRAVETRRRVDSLRLDLEHDRKMVEWLRSCGLRVRSRSK